MRQQTTTQAFRAYCEQRSNLKPHFYQLPTVQIWIAGEKFCFTNPQRGFKTMLQWATTYRHGIAPAGQKYDSYQELAKDCNLSPQLNLWS